MSRRVPSRWSLYFGNWSRPLNSDACQGACCFVRRPDWEEVPDCITSLPTRSTCASFPAVNLGAWMPIFLEREGVVEEDSAVNMLLVRHHEAAELKGVALQPHWSWGSGSGSPWVFPYNPVLLPPPCPHSTWHLCEELAFSRCSSKPFISLWLIFHFLIVPALVRSS